MAANNFANDTDAQRILLLNQRVAALSVPPTDSNNAVDLALGRLSANNGILLDQKGTRNNP
jgi:hypothetical protein